MMGLLSVSEQVDHRSPRESPDNRGYTERIQLEDIKYIDENENINNHGVDENDNKQHDVVLNGK